jgi:hypothetical protein
MKYSIESGTYKIATSPDGIHTYVYRFNDKKGEHIIVFLAAIVPKIGDVIVDGIHIPLMDWKINPDTSKWVEYYADRATDGDINPNDGPFSGFTASLPAPPTAPISPPAVPYSVNEIFAIGADGTANDSVGLVAKIDTFANTDTNTLDY